MFLHYKKSIPVNVLTAAKIMLQQYEKLAEGPGVARGKKIMKKKI